MEVLGEQIWREPDLEPPADLNELQRTTTRLEQKAVDLSAYLEEREGGLEASRFAGREPARALNQRG